MLQEMNVAEMQRKTFGVMQGLVEMQGWDEETQRDLKHLIRRSSNVCIGEGEGEGKTAAWDAVSAAMADLQKGCDVTKIKSVFSVVQLGNGMEFKDYTYAEEQMRKKLDVNDDLNSISIFNRNMSNGEWMKGYVAAIW